MDQTHLTPQGYSLSPGSHHGSQPPSPHLASHGSTHLSPATAQMRASFMRRLSGSSPTESSAQNLRSTFRKSMRLPSKMVESESESEHSDAQDDEAIAGQESTCFLLRQPKRAPALEHSALGCIPNSCCRLFVYNVIHTKTFESIIIFIILLNCVAMMLDDPTKEQAEWQKRIDYFFVAAFTFEMILKVFALGFVGHPGAYLRSNWNVLDFIIVLLSYLSLLPGFGNYTALRTLRVLRPLRSMNALPQLQMIVIGLLHSVKGLVNVLFLAIFIFTIFGVVAVQLWMGKFRFRCQSDLTGEIDEERFCTSSSNSLSGRQCDAGWTCVPAQNPNHGFTSFDNVLWAFLVIIQSITLEGWALLMYNTMDCSGWLSFTYFILLVLVGNYFVLNLALAVISFEFSRTKEKMMEQQMEQAFEEEPRFLFRSSANFGLEDQPEGIRDVTSNWEDTNHQDDSNEPGFFCALWMKFRYGIYCFTEGPTKNGRIPTVEEKNRQERRTEERSKSMAKSVLHMMNLGKEEDDEEQTTTWFMRFIILCIFLNTGVMAAQHHGESQLQTDISEWCNFVFTLIFVLELVLRLTGMGFRLYIADSFNNFDALVTVVSVIELLFMSGSSGFTVLRAFRLLRVFKLMKNFPSLREMIDVILIALRETGYLNVIILLYLFIAALVGMELFGGKLRQYETEDRPVRSHFDGFFPSFITVFQVLTRDSWPDTMWLAMEATNEAASLFFLFCVFTGDFVVLNLFLAILISSFDDAEDLDDDEEDEDAPLPSQIKQITLVSRPVGKMLLLDEEPQEMEAVDASEGTMSMICPRCGLAMQEPFPTLGKDIKQITPAMLHRRMCERMQFRALKENVVDQLLEEIGREGSDDVHASNFPDDSSLVVISFAQVAPGGAPKVRSKIGAPTPKLVEDIFGRAWEVGLLLSERMEDYLYIPSWSPLRSLLFEEKQLLQLKVGEEQIGGSLIAYTAANVPKEFLTNGGVSCFLFGPKNPFRIAVTQLVSHPLFDKVILMLILLSSLLMVFDNPRNDGTTTSYWIERISLLFSIIFIIEAFLKIIAYGFVLHQTAYLRDSWNVLDFTIVIVSIASFIVQLFGGANFSFFKVLRTFRTLRPLRVINRNHGIKMVVSTLLTSIRGIVNVVLISVLIFLVFAILGVQLFAGLAYHCTDDTVWLRANCTGNFIVFQDVYSFNETNQNWTYVQQAVNQSREWVTVDFNFDNTYNSFLALFHVSTLDNWAETMWHVVDAVDYDHGPDRDHAWWRAVYFIVFIIVGSFFLLNMFVGVIIFNFNKVKRQVDGLAVLREDQKLWVETQRMMLTFRPQRRKKPGQHPFRVWCFYVAEDPWFEVVTGAMILLNVLFIASEHYGQAESFTRVMTWSNYFFVGVFIIEAFLKIVAHGKNYFADGWCRFDFFLVVVSLVDIFFDGLIPMNVGLLRTLRIFRIMRMLALVKRAKEIRILLETLWYSLSALANIGAFMILLFFIYSILGVYLFSKVKRRGGLTHHTNFETFPTAFLFLMQVSTLDNWGVTMVSLMDNSHCGPETNDHGWDDCGNPVAPPLYFASFILIAGFVMVNLFIAIILDNFDTTMRLDRSKLKLTDLKKFADAWAQFDENATMLIETKYFPRLLAAIKPPLGIPRAADRYSLLDLTRRYAIPEHGGVLHFAETLIPLAREVLGVEFEYREIRDHEENWKQIFPDINDLKVLRYRQRRVTVAHYFAATFLAAAYRRRIAARVGHKLRRERRAEIQAFYDSHGVSDEGRDIIHVMDKQQEVERLRKEENDARISEYATRGEQSHRRSTIRRKSSNPKENPFTAK